MNTFRAKKICGSKLNPLANQDKNIELCLSMVGAIKWSHELGLFMRELQIEVIEVNVACQRQRGALLAYQYSVKLGIKIERTAYLSLIGLSIRLNSFHQVVEIVEEMIRQGLSLGTQLNSLLIHRLGCGREAAAAAKVFDLLPDREKSVAEYTALVGAYFSSGDAGMGLETFKIMKSKGVEFALGTYCVLITGLEKCGKAGEVEYYRKEMKQLQMKRWDTNISMEETICNLLFAVDFISLVR